MSTDPSPQEDEYTVPIGGEDPLADDGQSTVHMFALNKNTYPPVELLKAKINDTSRIPELVPRAYRGNMQREYAIDAPNIEERFLYAIAGGKYSLLDLYDIWRRVVASPQIDPAHITFVHQVTGYNSIYDGLGKDVALDNLFADIVVQISHFEGDPVRGNIDLLRSSILPVVIDTYKRHLKKK